MSRVVARPQPPAVHLRRKAIRMATAESRNDPQHRNPRLLDHREHVAGDPRRVVWRDRGSRSLRSSRSPPKSAARARYRRLPPRSPGSARALAASRMGWFADRYGVRWTVIYRRGDASAIGLAISSLGQTWAALSRPRPVHGAARQLRASMRRFMSMSAAGSTGGAVPHWR